MAGIVDGVTKLDRLQFDSKEAQQAATVRKMLVAMANDWRVLLIKLADRLHNMRTLAVMPEWKQRRTAQETLDIYAPLAHRLGIQEVQVAARGPALRHPAPEALRRDRADGGDPGAAARRVPGPGARAPCASGWTASGVEAERHRAPEAPVEHLREDGRAGQGVRRASTTWSASGSSSSPRRTAGRPSASIHAIWPPVQGRFKDYINSPKFNLYQSLHTTVIGLDGKPIEVQIRTYDGHAPGAGPSTASPPTGATKERTPRDPPVSAAQRRTRPTGGRSAWPWPRRTSSTTPRSSGAADRRLPERDTDPIEFLEALKLDLEQDEVYVFTPKGKVIALAGQLHAGRLRLQPSTPRSATSCIGAKVNGRLVPLDTRLQLGRHRRDLHLEGADGRAVA